LLIKFQKSMLLPLPAVDLLKALLLAPL